MHDARNHPWGLCTLTSRRNFRITRRAFVPWYKAMGAASLFVIAYPGQIIAQLPCTGTPRPSARRGSRRGSLRMLAARAHSPPAATCSIAPLSFLYAVMLAAVTLRTRRESHSRRAHERAQVRRRVCARTHAHTRARACCVHGNAPSRCVSWNQHNAFSPVERRNVKGNEVVMFFVCDMIVYQCVM